MILFVFVLTSSFVSAATTVSSCTALTTDGELYQLDQDIGSSGTCLNISADNVVLDCQNHLINYSQSQQGFGINNSGGFDNITIRNCLINHTNPENGTGYRGFGIFLNYSDNSTIESCNLTHGKAGILARNSTNVTINHNWFSRFEYGSGTIHGVACDPLWTVVGANYDLFESAVWLTYSNNVTIVNNTIYGDISEFGGINHAGTEAGITTCRCNYSNISYNNIYYIDTFALYIQSYSNHNDFFYNYVDGNDNTNDGVGEANCQYNNWSSNQIYSCAEWNIFLSESNYNWIVNNTVSYSSTGIRLGGASNYNEVYDNSVIDNSWGIRVEGEGNKIRNNLIDNGTDTITSGIYVLGDEGGTASNNLFIDNIILNAMYGIRMDKNNTENNVMGGYILNSPYSVYLINTINTTFINLNISNSTYDALLGTTDSNNFSFLNVSFNKSQIRVLGGTMYVKDYIDVFVNYSNGSIAPGATVRAYANDNSLKFTDVTDAVGYITRQNVTEYYVNKTNTYYKTNYSLNATINPISATKSQNFTGNLIDTNNITLTIDNTAPVAAITGAPSTIHPSEIVTINCSGTDTGGSEMNSVNATLGDTVICTNTTCSGNDCSCTGISVGGSVGTFSILCNVTDNSGNSNTATWPFTVTEDTGGGGGGGGGISPIQPEPLSYCGDGVCKYSDGENCDNCPEDCGACCKELCETFILGECCPGLTTDRDYNMDCYIQYEDCLSCQSGYKMCINCGNGICESCENYCNCPDDCEECENLVLDVEMVLGFEEGLWPVLPIAPIPIFQPLQRTINSIQGAFGI